MSIHISRDMYLHLGLHMQIRLYYVLPYKAKISAQHGIGFILDRCIVYLGLTMQNLQKKCLLIFEIFNIKKCTLFFGTEYIILHYILKTIGYPTFHFRPSKSKQDINMTDFHYSRPDNEIIILHISCARLFVFCLSIFYPPSKKNFIYRLPYTNAFSLDN